jgi:hypothetical protein
MFELILAAETAAAESASIPPIVVGGIALGILLALLLVVVQFGRGREHS